MGSSRMEYTHWFSLFYQLMMSKPYRKYPTNLATFKPRKPLKLHFWTPKPPENTPPTAPVITNLKPHTLQNTRAHIQGSDSYGTRVSDLKRDAKNVHVAMHVHAAIRHLDQRTGIIEKYHTRQVPRKSHLPNCRLISLTNIHVTK